MDIVTDIVTAITMVSIGRNRDGDGKQFLAVTPQAPDHLLALEGCFFVRATSTAGFCLTYFLQARPV
jgi:hypothetical protein